LYAKNCASYHGRDGRAKTFKGKSKHARNLADSEWQGRVGDERIFNSIMNGNRRSTPRLPTFALCGNDNRRTGIPACQFLHDRHSCLLPVLRRRRARMPVPHSRRENDEHLI
jgi:hypothetical protein